MQASGGKYQEAEAMLPIEMKPIFRRLVEEYKYLTQIHYGRGYVAYKVLAEMVLAGWRPSAEPHPDSKFEDL